MRRRPKRPSTSRCAARSNKPSVAPTHPWVAVALVRRDGPQWIAGIGLANVATQRTVTPDTLFRIGSTSKTFFALAVLKLEAEGKLRLDDPLKSHASGLSLINPGQDTDPVRLAHLLEHTSGWNDLARSQ